MIKKFFFEGLGRNFFEGLDISKSPVFALWRISPCNLWVLLCLSPLESFDKHGPASEPKVNLLKENKRYFT